MFPPNLVHSDMQAVIAGGWAACPALAEDMDIFIFAPTHAAPLDVGQRAVTYARATYGDRVLDKHMVSYSDPYSRPLTWTAADVMLEHVKVQLLITDASTIDELLDGFDISTHCVAITRHGQVIRGRNWTRPTQTPVLLRNHEASRERLQKIEERYRFSHCGPSDVRAILLR